MTKIIKKEDIKSLCMRACDDWETYVPLENSAGDVQFMRLGNHDKEKTSSLTRLNLDYESLIIPPKVIAFPQLECLFEFQKGKITDLARPPAKRLLFGLRSCDAQGILFMDHFFRRDFEDIYYLNRSVDKIVVIVGCKHPLDSCFCSSTKTGPFLPMPDELDRTKYPGFDLQLVDLGNQYVVEIGSKRGQEFANDYKMFFDNASKEDINDSGLAKRNAEKSIKLKVDFQKALKRFCEDKVPKEIYERIAQRCIYCGGCLYVCPTCSCFNTFDEQAINLGRRYRNWDACIFEGYTREASGHNPRVQRWMRTSRRYEHKLKYDYLLTGISGCVGCGRCLLSCPVNIGISQVIQEVSRY